MALNKRNLVFEIPSVISLHLISILRSAKFYTQKEKLDSEIFMQIEVD